MDEHPVAASESEAIAPHLRDAVLWGTGTFGKVYRATDLAGRHVAVKVLAERHATQPEVLWQFAGEFRRLARLEHPSFPAAREEGRTSTGLPYYSMDWVDGDEPEAGFVHSAERVRAIVAGIAEALTYLHGLGFVHGDLKPENLRVTPQNRVVLLDVGLMGLVGQKREVVSGTLEYLAPEILRKATVGSASDMYALGVVAYKLLAGALPFMGSPGELVRAQLQLSPPPLSEHALDHDPALENLILDLLAKDPARRPTSRDVLMRLGIDVSGLSGTGKAPCLLAGAYVGRQDLLASWQAMLDTSRVEAPWLLIAGSHGMGKTRTLDELRVMAQMAGRTWLGAACLGDGDAPAAPMRTILSQALAVAKLEASGITAAWLAGEVPTQLSEMEPSARKVALYNAVAQDLARAASLAGGLAIGIDNWHRADGASQDVVAFIQRASTRSDVVWALAGEPVEPGALVAHSLAPLSDAEATALIAARIGAVPPAALLTQALPIAAGNPLLLDLLLEHFAQSGQLDHGPAGLSFAPDGTGPLAPTTLAALWSSRTQGLSPGARRFAVAAAVAAPAGDIGVPLLAAVAGLTGSEPAQAVDALLAIGLLVASGGRVRLAMPEVAEVFKTEVNAEERARWARELALRVLEGESGQRPKLAEVPLDVLTRAAWLALSGDDPALGFELACEAGQRSLTMAAPAEAVRLLMVAGVRLPKEATPGQRVSLLLPRAEAERYLDHVEPAMADYELAHQATVEAEDGVAELRALVGWAKCLQLKGDYPGALERLGEASRRAIALGDGRQQARAVMIEARLLMFQGGGSAALDCCRRAAELAKAAGALAVLAGALSLQGTLLVQEDLRNAPQALELLDEAIGLTVQLGDRLGQLAAIESLGNIYLSLGDLSRAGASFVRYGEVAREVGADTDATFALVNQAIVAGEAGDGELAGRLAAEVERRALLAKRKYLLAAARAVAGQAAWRRGRLDEAMPSLDDALTIALDIKNRYLEEFVRLLAAEAAMIGGDLERARHEVEAAAALIQQTGHAESLPRLKSLRAELARRGGDLAGASLQASEVLDTLDLVAVHHARRTLAEVALARGESGLAHVEAALTISRRWDAAWHEQADSVLLARATLAHDPSSAVVLARDVATGSAEAGRPVNPYARAGAALVLAQAGEHASAIPCRLQAVEALRPGFASASAAHRHAALAGLDLADLADALDPAVSSLEGSDDMPLAIDPLRYAQVVEALSAETDETAIGRAALLGAMELVKATRGYLLSYEDGRLRQALTHGINFTEEIEHGFSNSIAEHVLFGGEPLYVQDASGDSNWQSLASVAALGLRTVLCLPLGVPDAILGVLYMDREDLEPALLPADLAFMNAFATFAASSIHRERARGLALQAADLGRRTANLGTELARQGSAEGRRRATLAALVDASGAERGFWLAGDTALASHARAGQPLPYEPEHISQSVVRWVREHREPLTLVGADESEAWQPTASIQALGLRTVWCLPAAESSDAVIYLDSAGVTALDPAAGLAALEALLGYAGLLELAPL